MPDDPHRRQDPAAPAGLGEKQGGDHDVAADVSPPEQAPDYAGGKLDETGPGGRATDRPGGMPGEG